MKSHFLHPVKNAFAWAVLALTAATLCTSCSREQSDVDDESYRGAENNLKGTSRFLKAIEKDKERYRETQPPAAPPVFRWDFANKDVHTHPLGKCFDRRPIRVNTARPPASIRFKPSTWESKYTRSIDRAWHLNLICHSNYQSAEIAGIEQLFYFNMAMCHNWLSAEENTRVVFPSAFAWLAKQP